LSEGTGTLIYTFFVIVSVSVVVEPVMIEFNWKIGVPWSCCLTRSEIAIQQKRCS